ncbi:MAG: dihydroorotate dehydrogenase electron transfer subunit [Chromatiales bacterium]
MSCATSQRGTLHVEEAEVVAHSAHAARQYVIRLYAPQIAANAGPGSFVHLQCDPVLPMRRPMSIMRADARAGCIDILYKAHGHGTALLAGRQVGDRLSLIGPIGVTFTQSVYRARPLLLGGGVGIPPMLFLAEHMKRGRKTASPLVLMGSEIPFPFTTRPSRILVQGMPEGVIAAMPLLEDWGIPSRLASLQGYPGCFDGFVTDLARWWLDSLSGSTVREVEVYACGPAPMLKAVRKLALDYGLACQVSLEEYMACAVGGCAGCTVRIETAKGPAMKRVCVDGPVFDARSVVFP